MSQSDHASAARDANPMTAALRATRSAFLWIFLFSGIINILMLTGPIFMIQVYDRVLSSRSAETLLLLSIMAAAAYSFQGFLEFIRSRILSRIGEWVSVETAPTIFRNLIDRVSASGHSGDMQAPMRDMEGLRGFLSSPGPAALADLPWLPIFVIVVWMLHPWLGMLTIGGTLFLVVLTWVAEMSGRKPVEQATRKLEERNLLVDSSMRGAEAIAALGMRGSVEKRFMNAHDATLKEHHNASDLVGGLSTTSKVARYILQSANLGLGAYLAINDQISAGAIIAANVLSSRAMAPVDQVLMQWRSFVSARQSYARLNKMVSQRNDTHRKLALPPPKSKLEVHNITIGAPIAPGSPPTQRRILVRDISFALKAGDGLGVIGPSASGKSSLARALVNVWRPIAGTVSVDGAPLDRWPEDQIGQHVGYLPQDIQLFDGTVAENIARFSETAQDDDVVQAAQSAGLHEMIMKLPQGYATRIGMGGEQLSGGLRQRVGLARALFGEPFLVVLDEPNAALDQEGEEALTRAMKAVRARGGIVVVIAHRPSALAAIDRVLVMREGLLDMLGPKVEVMKKLQERAGARPGGPGPAAPAQQVAALRPNGAAQAVVPQGQAATAQGTAAAAPQMLGNVTQLPVARAEAGAREANDG